MYTKEVIDNVDTVREVLSENEYLSQLVYISES